MGLLILTCSTSIVRDQRLMFGFPARGQTGLLNQLEGEIKVEFLIFIFLRYNKF